MKIHNFSLDEARKFADEIRAVFKLSPFRLYLALDAIYKKYKFLHSYIKFFNFLEFYFWHRLIIIFHIFYSNFFSKRLIQKVSFPNYIFWKAIYSQAFDLQSKNYSFFWMGVCRFFIVWLSLIFLWNFGVFLTFYRFLLRDI